MINKDIKKDVKSTKGSAGRGGNASVKQGYGKRSGRPAPEDGRGERGAGAKKAEDGKKSGGGAKKSISYNAHGGVCALYRALSKLSVCSRTAAKELILGGRVRVNGTVINDLMYGVCMGKDKTEKMTAGGHKASGKMPVGGGFKGRKGPLASCLPLSTI